MNTLCTSVTLFVLKKQIYPIFSVPDVKPVSIWFSMTKTNTEIIFFKMYHFKGR